MTRYDVIIAGAGLSGAMIALALKEKNPALKIKLLDQRDAPRTSQTWSFHETDIRPEWYAKLRPYLCGEWSSQEVYFPKFHRQLKAGYASLDAPGLLRALQDQDLQILWGAHVQTLDEDAVTLADGAVLEAPLVIDARGFEAQDYVRHGWQKFVGIEYEMDAPHGIEKPVIMDARVPQEDGFRFVYLLPFTETKILVEDTCYSTNSELDVSAYKASLARYLNARGWQGKNLRFEKGVLPIPMAFDAKAFWAQAHKSVPVGMRAELFQPVTGYSLPTAIRIADVIAQTELTSDAVFKAVRAYALSVEPRNRYLRLLNRMLFMGAPAETRYRLLERFYTLPEPLIERFYANDLTMRDQLRILTGKPPIPIRAALPCLSERKLLQNQTSKMKEDII